MSGVAVCRYLLANNQALVAVVPAARIFAGVIPLNTVADAISVTDVSDSERLTVSMLESNRLITERVQVTVQAKTFALLKSILPLVRTALANRHGTVNGVALDSILPDVTGPYFPETDLSLHAQSKDFIVKWKT